MTNPILPTLISNTALIVLYKSKIMASTTVTSLLKAATQGVQLKIIIWNNGPDLVNLDDVTDFKHACHNQNITFEIYQDVRNISLSYIYNFVINKHPESDFFTILDQDSILSSDFLVNLSKHASYDLICPKIYPVNHPGEQKWPCNELLNTCIFDGEFDTATFFTVGSGLTLSASLLARIIDKKGFVFATDYVLYNVDAALIREINKLSDVSGYCCSTMLHSESGSSKKSGSENNKLEWGLMKVIFRIHKKRKYLLQNLLYICWFALKTRCTWDSFSKLIICAFEKQHPRSRFTIQTDLVPDYQSDPLK